MSGSPGSNDARAHAGSDAGRSESSRAAPSTSSLLFSRTARANRCRVAYEPFPLDLSWRKIALSWLSRFLPVRKLGKLTLDRCNGFVRFLCTLALRENLSGTPPWTFIAEAIDCIRFKRFCSLRRMARCLLLALFK